MEQTTLQDLTGQESGAVLYDGGDIWIGNWTGINGLPREFATGTIGLSESLDDAEPCDVPSEAIEAMEQHAADNGDETSEMETYKAWRVDGATVVVCRDWH